MSEKNLDSRRIPNLAVQAGLTGRHIIGFLFKKSILAALLIGSLALQVATLTVDGVFQFMSDAVEFVAAKTLGERMTVRKRHAAQVATLRQEPTVTFRGKQHTVRQAVGETTRRIARRVARNAVRNVASIFTESIPYIGIAVIITTTTLELKDDCDTMKDLEALNRALQITEVIEDDSETVCAIRIPTMEEIEEWIKEQF